jgi:hypothetical protein
VRISEQPAEGSFLPSQEDKVLTLQTLFMIKCGPEGSLNHSLNRFIILKWGTLLTTLKQKFGLPITLVWVPGWVVLAWEVL